MKKYLLFFAAFTLLLVGCAQNEIVENRSEKNLIGFRTLNDKVTKAANDATSNYGVYAHWNKASEAWFMENVEIKGDTDKYVGVPYYWPHDGEVDFFAYAPYNTTNGTISDGTVGTLSIEYTVPADAQEDFTVAKPVTGATKDNGKDAAGNDLANNVHLQFAHMLSKIEVDAKLDDALGHETTGAGYTMSFTSAKVTVLKNKGTVNLTADAPVLSEDGVEATYSGQKSYNVLPQTSTGVKLQLMGVEIKHNGVVVWPVGETPATTDLKEYTIVTNDVDTDNFVAGKHYKVTFTISNNAIDDKDGNVFQPAITFSSDVSGWTSGGVDIDQPGV